MIYPRFLTKKLKIIDLETRVSSLASQVMVQDAIKALKDRKGSSRQAMKNVLIDREDSQN